MRCHCDGCSRAARAPPGGLRRVQRARVWKVAVGGRRPMSHVHVACAVRRERVPRGGERSTVTRDRSSSSFDLLDLASWFSTSRCPPRPTCMMVSRYMYVSSMMYVYSCTAQGAYKGLDQPPAAPRSAQAPQRGACPHMRHTTPERPRRPENDEGDGCGLRTARPSEGR